MRGSRIPVLAVTSAALTLFLYAPLAVAVLYAFNGGRNLSWPPQGFSLRWFQFIVEDPLFRQAFATSLIAATVSSSIATLIGTAAAFVFTRRASRVSSTLEAGARLPVMLPPLFIGIGLLAAMKLTAVRPGMPTIIAGHVIVAVPFVVIIVAARLRGYDVELEAAARDLGAGPLQALRRITLPIIAPAAVGAGLLAFAFSFDETLVTNFTSGIETTVPLYVLAKLRRYIDPSGNAVATILLLVPWIALVAGAVFLRRTPGSAEAPMVPGGVA
jgi:ABC-type spermidine/putrescine transport system permease subunit II